MHTGTGHACYTLIGRIIFPVLVVINDGIGEVGSDGILGAATSSAVAGAGLGQGAGQDDDGGREFHGWLVGWLVGWLLLLLLLSQLNNEGEEKGWSGTEPIAQCHPLARRFFFGDSASLLARRFSPTEVHRRIGLKGLNRRLFFIRA